MARDLFDKVEPPSRATKQTSGAEMKKQNLMVAMIAGLALATAPILGCGDSEDPSIENQNQNQNQNQTTNQNDADVGNGGDDDTGETNQNGGDPDTGNGNGNGDDDTGDNNGDGPDCTLPSDCDDGETCEDGECVSEEIVYDCSLHAWFTGPIGEREEVLGTGGEPTTDPFTHSAGLQDILDEIEAAVAEAEADPGIDIATEVIDIEFDDPIEITEATVTATGLWNKSIFWLGDADAGLYFRVDQEEELSEGAKVGDKVSFVAEGLKLFRGTPQISVYSDWTVVEEGTDVSYIELDDEELDIDLHYGRLVRLHGQLTANSWECGSTGNVTYTCFEAIYGPDGEQTTVYRTPSSFDEPGDCFTFLGPIGSFPNRYVEGAEPQIDLSQSPKFGDAWAFTSSN